MASLPVYRTYVGAARRASSRRGSTIVSEHATRPRHADARIVDVHRRRVARQGARCRAGPRKPRFVQRLQQVSGPATAKGVEDTALYVYVPLASRNEVGGAPRSSDRRRRRRVCTPPISERAERWPLALLATNTHDTKRSADVRARLGALSEMPEEWQRAVRRWRRLNDKHRSR